MSKWSTPEKDTPKGKLKSKILYVVHALKFGERPMDELIEAHINSLLDELYTLGQNETNTCCSCDDACKDDICHRCKR